jgi:Cytochrome bd terminal oxidase subunit I
MFGLTAVELARIQFGFTISFHTIFPAITIGLANYLTVLEGLAVAASEQGCERSVGFHAASSVIDQASRARTSTRAWIRCCICASVWKGVGVMRSRSRPRGTVG